MMEDNHQRTNTADETEKVDSAIGDNHSAYTQSLRSSLLESVRENGRSYHRYKAGNEYPFLNDEEEQDRLSLQHEAFVQILHGKLYLPPLGKNVLIPSSIVQDPHYKHLGRLTMANFLTGLEAFTLRLWTGVLGMSYEEVVAYLEDVKKDIVNPKIQLDVLNKVKVVLTGFSLALKSPTSRGTSMTL